MAFRHQQDAGADFDLASGGGGTHECDEWIRHLPQVVGIGALAGIARIGGAVMERQNDVVRDPIRSKAEILRVSWPQSPGLPPHRAGSEKTPIFTMVIHSSMADFTGRSSLRAPSPCESARNCSAPHLLAASTLPDRQQRDFPGPPFRVEQVHRIDPFVHILLGPDDPSKKEQPAALRRYFRRLRCASGLDREESRETTEPAACQSSRLPNSNSCVMRRRGGMGND